MEIIITLSEKKSKYPALTDRLISSLPRGPITVSPLNAFRIFIPIFIMATDIFGNQKSAHITDPSEFNKAIEVLPNASLEFGINSIPDFEYKLRISNIVLLPSHASG